MKPPSRHRVKPARYCNKRTDKRRRSAHLLFEGWSRAEQQSLASCLKRQYKVIGSTGEIDYSALKQCLPKRSTAEIRGKIEALKTRVIRQVMHQVLRQKEEEKRTKKPIEVWEGVALSVTGALEESITTAFSQMLIVSSTEPRTLRNSDPPHEDVVRQQRSGTKTYSKRLQKAFPFLTGSSTTDAAPRLVNPKNRAAASVVPAQATATGHSPVVGTGGNPRTPLHHSRLSGGQSAGRGATETGSPSTSHAAAVQPGTPVPASSQSPGPSASHSQRAGQPAGTHPHASAVVDEGLYNLLGAVSQSTEGARSWSAKCSVDFEKIYSFLSTVPNPKQEDMELTPMENALLLDLLMCLPEELPLLDCNELQDHMRESYALLSAPRDPGLASPSAGGERATIPGSVALSDLGRASQTSLQPPTDHGAKGAIGGSGPDSEDGERMDSTDQGQAGAATAGSSGNLAGVAGDSGSVALDGGGLPRNAAGEGGAGEGRTTSQSSGDSSKGRSDWEKAGVCPLNPFMVPLRLLARRQAR